MGALGTLAATVTPMTPLRVSAPRARTVLLALNGAGIAAAAAFAVRGVRQPSFVRPSQPVTQLAQFWAASSAVRTWALAAPLSVALCRRPAGRADLLVVAGLVQCGDAVLGARQRNRAMTVAPAIMGAVHLVSARLLRD